MRPSRGTSPTAASSSGSSSATRRGRRGSPGRRPPSRRTRTPTRWRGPWTGCRPSSSCPVTRTPTGSRCTAAPSRARDGPGSSGGLHLLHGRGAAGDLHLRPRPRGDRARHPRGRPVADRDAQRALRRHGTAVRRRRRGDPGTRRRRPGGLGGAPRRGPAGGGAAHRRGPPGPGLRRVRAGRDRPARDGPAAGRRDRAGRSPTAPRRWRRPGPRGPATPTGWSRGGSAPTWRCTPGRGR